MKPSRYSAVQLLTALVFLFVTAPFIEDLPRGDLIEASLLSIVMVFAVLAVAGRRRTFVTALVLVIPALVGKWMNHLSPGLVSPVYFLAASVVFFGFVVAHLLNFVLRSTRVDTNVLCAGIAGYVLLGLLWVPAYALISRVNPGAFSLSGNNPGTELDGFNAFYFSFVTLCTVGYGDVTPVSNGAKMLAVTEAMLGIFYVAVLISRLVAIHSSTPPSAGTDTADKA